MSRGSRVLIENVCYHIITRGNQKQRVFLDKEDCGRYLGIVRKAKRRYGTSLYCYCLMPNHVHMLIEAKEVKNIAKFMQWVNRGYTAYFNSKHSKVGHLWQGRFTSKPIIKDQYLIHCANYIEGNPVRADMVGDIADYEWSSYRERCIASGKDLLEELRGHL